MVMACQDVLDVVVEGDQVVVGFVFWVEVEYLNQLVSLGWGPVAYHFLSNFLLNL